MLAARLLRPGTIVITDEPVPEPAAGELVIRVEAALTCGTDIKTFRRGHPRIPLPIPMGHEASGTVAAVGSGVTAFREGDAVAVVPTVPCGSCRRCSRGRDSLCSDAVGRMNFGAFAEFLRLPAHIVAGGTFHRPATLDAETAAALEPIACVVHGAGRVRLEDADAVVILGDGPIALLYVQIARHTEVPAILVAGRHDHRLAAAADLGAHRVVRLEGEALRSYVLDHTQGHGADVVIECTGSREAWRLAPELAAVGGEVLLYGGLAAGERVDVDPFRLHYEEVDLKGAFHYGRADVRAALEHLVAGRIDVHALITHRMPLARFEEAFELALSRTALKVAVTP